MQQILEIVPILVTQIYYLLSYTKGNKETELAHTHTHTHTHTHIQSTTTTTTKNNNKVDSENKMSSDKWCPSQDMNAGTRMFLLPVISVSALRHHTRIRL